ncbi:cutinase gene palindrome-binding protein [Diplogelasinospora grovesii]|uniref:Cutinase gene palindrome-binding protein n=1 Tax=Diplogelasinospora grovesii TaxID=303347 RepID=A0AAN6S3S1_9PEZI|nr:cutinase gene palindrome-binding protein [Diplogelasinospora grovesii]
MSHGPPRLGASLYGFENLDTDPNDFMFLLDGPMFDNMAMNLDPDMSQYSLTGMAPSAMQQSSRLGALAVPGHDGGDALTPGDIGADSMPGAGPSPTTTFGTPSAIAAGSTLTEFTKRRNWPARVVEELKDFLHILDANGRVKHVSPSVEKLTGYRPDEMIDTFLKDLVHPDDVGVFTAEFNESIASGTPLRLFYRLKKKDGTYAIFESVGHAHIAAAKFALNLNNQSPFCQAVFMMARPYPTKNATLLDSFLEHKIENERLQRRIAELKREEEQEAEESQRTWRLSQEGRSDMTPSEDTTITGGATPYLGFHMTNMASPPGHGDAVPMSAAAAADTRFISSLQSMNMPPPDRPVPPSLNVALTRENLEGIAGSKPDSIREKMARYEGASHADTIERLTGLRYQEGERSRGITTGNASPTLIKGDAGIAIPLDRDPRTGEKKKKTKVAEEYVCTDCGTLESPEWRKGPGGPKTLCNACGLRWAKKEKKRNQAANRGKGGGDKDNQANSDAGIADNGD